MEIICVLDLDETLGFYEEGIGFHKRPFSDFMFEFLQFSSIKFILWSYGDDAYVKLVMNSFITDLRNMAYKVFGKSQCKLSKYRYDVIKCSEHIRKLFKDDIFLIGIDDRVNEMMDNKYDLRINVEPYTCQNKKDIELVIVIQKIITYINGLN